MMNKNERMEALRNAGVATDKFFDLSLRIPFGAEVVIKVDGKEMVIGNNDCEKGQAVAVCTNTVGIRDIPFEMLGNPSIGKSYYVSDDTIVKDILNNGYVFNSRVDGRFVTAQTFKMLNGKSYNRKTRTYETGWDAYLRNNYNFMYQFDMMLDELHKLARMEKDKDPEFDRLSSFFTKAVVVETCKHYIRQLRKFIKKQPNRKCKGVPYVKLNKYGNVFIKDLDERVYKPLEKWLNNIENSNDYIGLEFNLKQFVSRMPKLPYDTPKANAWKDAFKGKGSYVTLLNIIKFHGVTVQNYETKAMLDTYGSISYVESLLETYHGDYWKFHELLKATIELNNFDLKESIKAHK